MYRNCNGEKDTDSNVQENQSEGQMDDVDYPYLASNPFPPIPETQVIDFKDPVKKSFDFNDPVKDPLKKALEEADIRLKNDSLSADRPGALTPPWTSPMVPSYVYCLTNRFENAATALSSLLFHLDLSLEDYPNRHPSNKKHLDLYRQFGQQALKLRQLDKQFLKTKREIFRILDLDYF